MNDVGKWKNNIADAGMKSGINIFLGVKEVSCTGKTESKQTNKKTDGPSGLNRRFSPEDSTSPLSIKWANGEVLRCSGDQCVVKP